MKSTNKQPNEFVNVQLDIRKMFTTKNGHCIFINYFLEAKPTTLEKFTGCA